MNRMAAIKQQCDREAESVGDDYEAEPFVSGIVELPRYDDRQADRVFALAVRLIRGERFDLVDQHGRRWNASATTLSLVGADGCVETPVIVASAADIAMEVIRRGLRPRPVAPARSGTE
jgi:hypothetical protein